MFASRLPRFFLIVTTPFLFTWVSVSTAGELLETLIVRAEQTSEDTGLGARLVTNNASNFLPGARAEITEVLMHLPGVQVDSRSNYAQDARVSLRGFGARSAFGIRGIDILVDGVPMSTPDGQAQLSSVMLDNIADVQVLRGPIAALYGNSSGGVIALQTARPESTSIYSAVAADQQGLQRQVARGQWHRDRIGLSAQLANTSTNGARPHSYAERKQAAFQLFYTTDANWELAVKSEQNDDPLLQDPLGLSPSQWRENPLQTNQAAETFDTRKSVNHQQTSISLRDIHSATRWQVALWRGARDIEQYLGFSGEAITSSGGVVDLARDFAGVNATLSRDIELLSRPATLSFGSEMSSMDDHRRGYVNNEGVATNLRRDEQGQVESHDVYSVLKFDITSQLHIFGGLRYSDIEFEVQDFFVTPGLLGNPDDSGARTFSETSFAWGLDYHLTETWHLFTSSGEGYETPTLTEMAYQTAGTGLNTGLDPALNRQYEWGLSFTPKTAGQLTFTQYIIDTKNELVVDQSINGRTSYRNAAQTDRKGIEVDGYVDINQIIRAQITAQYIKATYSEGQWSGNRVPGVAREQYQAQLQWRPWGTDSLIASAGLQYRSAITANDNNDIVAPSATTAELGVEGHYLQQHWTLGWWLKIHNVGDKNYVGSVIVNQANSRAFEPGLGSNVAGGASLSFNFY